jgi:arabinofuranosyltransferase
VLTAVGGPAGGVLGLGGGLGPPRVGRGLHPGHAPDPGLRPGRVDRAAVLDDRRAVQCPGIAEMLDSVRTRLTPQRFWDNLTGAVDRTAFRYSRLPALAPATVDLEPTVGS